MPPARTASSRRGKARSGGRHDVVVNVQGDLPTIDPGGHRGLHHAALGPAVDIGDPRRRHRAGGGEDQSQRGEDGGQPDRAGPLPRALLHPRDGALGRRAALSSHRPLRLSPRRAAALRRPAAVAAGDAREAGAAAGARGRHAHRCGRRRRRAARRRYPHDLEGAREIIGRARRT